MISVQVDQQDAARLFAAADRVYHTIETQGKDTMQFKCATDYYQLVMANIMKRHSPKPAYSKRYRNWKYEYGWMGYPSPWRLGGDLIRSLGAYRYDKGYIGGVQPGVMDSGGKSWFGEGKNKPKGPSKSIEMYGRVEEHRRAVFAPTMVEYAKTGWITRLNELKKRAESDWR